LSYEYLFCNVCNLTYCFFKNYSSETVKTSHKFLTLEIKREIPVPIKANLDNKLPAILPTPPKPPPKVEAPFESYLIVLAVSFVEPFYPD